MFFYVLRESDKSISPQFWRKKPKIFLCAKPAKNYQSFGKTEPFFLLLNLLSREAQRTFLVRCCSAKRGEHVSFLSREVRIIFLSLRATATKQFSQRFVRKMPNTFLCASRESNKQQSPASRGGCKTNVLRFAGKKQKIFPVLGGKAADKNVRKQMYQKEKVRVF